MTIFFCTFLNSELEEIKNENTQLRRELASWEEIKDNNDDLTQLQIENGRMKSELKRLKNVANDEVMEVEKDELTQLQVENGQLKSEVKRLKNMAFSGEVGKIGNKQKYSFEFSRHFVLFFFFYRTKSNQHLGGRSGSRGWNQNSTGCFLTLW